MFHSDHYHSHQQWSILLAMEEEFQLFLNWQCIHNLVLEVKKGIFHVNFDFHVNLIVSKMQDRLKLD